MVVYVENLKDKDVSKKKAHSAKSTLLPSWRRTVGVSTGFVTSSTWQMSGALLDSQQTDRQTEEEQIAKAVGEKNTLQ